VYGKVVSEASMRAPEEVFASKGLAVGATEVTQAERKRTRAKRKRQKKKHVEKARLSSPVAAKN
jgi:U3 small nucleolar RNA-associated protein MPP10